MKFPSYNQMKVAIAYTTSFICSISGGTRFKALVISSTENEGD